MISHLQLSNIGPAPNFTLDFGKRLNLLTGDNGLGKSFILDVAWWALTRKWPAEINPQLTAGKMARPMGPGPAKIKFTFKGKVKNKETYESTFLKQDQAWTGRPGRPTNPGLVLYAMADGSIAVWDPHRNYWRTKNKIDVQERIPAYVFSPSDIWDGQMGPGQTWICNGLIRDWASWQKENGTPFDHLKEILKILSPSGEEVLLPGPLTRISLDDSRDMPTLTMPYNQDVPVVHASAGMRRVLALAYVLVWAWEEHKHAARQLGESETQQITFLIDEVESHLHPSWQRRIVPSLLHVMDALSENAAVQLIAATHSPLIMASVEPTFDSEKDAWFDFDFENKTVVLRKRPYEKHGDAGTWLVSEAFDLKSGRSIEYEELITEASALLGDESPSQTKVREMNQKLISALSPKDDFLFRWRSLCDHKGLLP